MKNTQGNKLSKSNVADIVLLTPLQQGLLFHYLNDVTSSLYFEQLVVTFKGVIDIEKLKDAWQYVANNNEILRTVYRWEGLNDPIQIVLKTYEIEFYEYDLSTVEEKDNQIEVIKAQDQSLGIDITKHPWRVTFCKLNQEQCIMILSNHHILFDGWSSGVILKELLEAYNAYTKERDIAITNKTSFRNFVDWQYKKNSQEDMNFWKDYLGDESVPNSIRDNQTKRDTISQVKHYYEEIDISLTHKISNFTKQYEVTSATLLYSAWAILLMKYNASRDCIFGMTLSGRTPEIRGMEDMVGLFINTVPLKVHIEENENILQLLQHVGETSRLITEHGYTALTDIKAQSQIARDEELFKSIVIIESYPLPKTLNAPDSNVVIDDYYISEASNYELSLEIGLRDEISLRYDYDSNVYTSNIISRINEHFIRILEQIVESPQLQVSELNLLSKVEYHKLTNEFNNTKISFQKGKTLQQLFEEQVEKNPEQTAVVFENQELSYRQLNHRANSIAKQLIEKGVGPESVVGVMIERSIDMIVGLLAVLKAGGAYLPIDIEFPEERISYMLEDSNAILLLTQKKYAHTFDIHAMIIEEMVVDEQAENPSVQVTDSNIAYLIYTSGSTGKPKGTMIEHHSVNNFIVGMMNAIDLTDVKTILSITTVSFDIFGCEMYLPLLNGLKLVVASHLEQMDPSAFAKLVINNDIDLMQTTPSRINMILSSCDDLVITAFKKFKVLLIGGEAVTKGVLNRINEICEVPVYNMYGPTETTIWSTAGRVYANQDISIGKPIANTHIYIMDHNQLVPIGVPGELCISGEGVSRGYYHKEALTQEKFIQSPVCLDERIYRTGDLAMWLEDGSIHFIGRKDFQVKIRGHRIELGEIEYKMVQSGLVEEAAVIIKDTADGDKAICAYYVSKKNVSIEVLRAALTKDLPNYMIPTYFILIDKMPLTANQKIDRKALPQPKMEQESKDIFIGPENEIEVAISGIWEEVLNQKNISIDKDFFYLGGNSILLIKLHSKINKIYTDGISVQELFDNRTIKSQAQLINNKFSVSKKTEKKAARKITL